MFSRYKIKKIESKKIVALAFASCLLALLCLLAYCTLHHSLISLSSRGQKNIRVCCADEMINDYTLQSRIRRRRQFREGEWTYWTSWTSCLEYPNLRAYVQTRQRICNGGIDCGGGEPTQVRACLPNNPNITTAAEWKPWAEWSECQIDLSLTSAPFRTRWRECDCGPCVGDNYQQVVCGDNDVVRHQDVYRLKVVDSNVYCQWMPWSVWSTCSSKCGRTARSYRLRTCSCTIRHGCTGSPIEDRLCEGLPACDNSRRLYNAAPTEDTLKNLGYPCNLYP